MKKTIFFLAFALLTTLVGFGQELRIELGTVTIETSTKYLVYPANQVYFVHNTTTNLFQTRDLSTNNLLYSANISTVVIDTFTTIGNVTNAIGYTHFIAETGTISYYFPKDNVSIRQRYPYAEIWAANPSAKSAVAALWSGQADDIDVNTEDYEMRVASSYFLQTSFDTDNEDYAPEITAGDGLGSGASVSILGNALAGEIEINVGTSPDSSSTLANVRLPRGFPDAFFVYLQEENKATSKYRSRFYVEPDGSQEFNILSGDPALPNGTVLKFSYFIVGYSEN